MANNKTNDPLLPFVQHHPWLTLGGMILFGAALGRVLGEEVTIAYRAIRGNDRGEYGKK